MQKDANARKPLKTLRFLAPTTPSLVPNQQPIFFHLSEIFYVLRTNSFLFWKHLPIFPYCIFYNGNCIFALISAFRLAGTKKQDFDSRWAFSGPKMSYKNRKDFLCKFTRNHLSGNLSRIFSLPFF
jgi:hypothetical protein